MKEMNEVNEEKKQSKQNKNNSFVGKLIKDNIVFERRKISV